MQPAAFRRGITLLVTLVTFFLGALLVCGLWFVAQPPVSAR